MPAIFPRVVDIAVIVFGAFLPILIEASGGPHAEIFDGTLVAFAAALSLSVFPACGIYEASRRRSPVHLISRTALAWLVVQGGTVVLLYVLHRAQILSSAWFAYWTVTTGIGLLIFRAVTLAIFGLLARASRQVKAATLDQVGHVAQRMRTSGIAKRIVKRAFDVAAASCLIVVLSPALAVIAFLVKRDGGPAVFGHVRIGRDGRPFKCLKFRSMVMNADAVLKALLERDPHARAEWEREFKLKNDVRITPIGRFLRRSSLDELPQLMNVVRGEMSLVGPRPVVEAELARYGDDVRYYLAAKPGMTGLWQVSGRNDTSYATRVSLDVSYVKEWSLRRDLVILLQTVNVVLRGSGAY
ncbi:sugar transferase [Burkholderia pseudomallei]|uniref:sugar transferase n=1 Tax=Burkholderia pseudomallei TaxID=28450 RepID=UPI0004CE23E7|nr:sugar transferase [Burkholderia pseudomallei]AIP11699.1 exopolysaccharide biosynthesis polyprenyl glycosylphosphotransferase family protein [Burkholderia pseudomallei]OMW31276.1 UDP-phosphate galactose phosphotransferase [Burkholderia pseudomallei]ONA23715.1 UDP-phosphate galactose phosphotransferase [Burkholderia pseudomallei]ONA38887.1 UDP-phosphate galactose phosphotransferase [Burkholderia pseudomallei]ONA42432.1 UDP-phosphate galactose phosphotransferase [Burkholderia pseudomallei]